MLKGKSIIELYDKDTMKLIERKESENIVTDAYKNIIQPSIPLDIGLTNTYKFNLASITPLIDKVFGGVMLFSEEREANASNFMISKNDYNLNNFVGSAGGAYSGESIYRGTLNKGESGYNENTKEYTQVWDFPSHAANGKVKSISLTSRWLANQQLIDGEISNSLFLPLGLDFEKEGVQMYPSREGFHYSHIISKSVHGNYIYNKNQNTFVYCKLVDNKKYQFIEISKKMTLGLTENFGYSDSVVVHVNDTNLYNYSEIFEIDYTDDTNFTKLSDSRYIQYYAGFFYFVIHTIDKSGNINFKVYKINAETYEKVEGFQEFNLNISDLSGKTIYPRVINDKIYFTSDNDYLYILNMSDGTFKSIPINNTNTSVKIFETLKFYDTVVLVPFEKTLLNTPIFILNGEDVLIKNNLNFIDYAGYQQSWTKINTDDSVVKYPLALAVGQTNRNQSESINVICMPYLATINNLGEEGSFVKNSSNVLKVKYILKEF